MPAVSKKQFRFMQALAHGAKLRKQPEELSKEKAKEYVSSNKGEKAYSKLPEESKPKKRKYKFMK